MLESLYMQSELKIPLEDFENWEYYHVAKLFKYDFNISRVIKLNEISGSELLGYTKKDICDKFELNDASLATFLNIHTLLCNKIYQPDHANASINIEGTKKVGSNELGENISRVESISTVDSLNNDYEHFAHDNSTAHIDILNPGNKGKSIFEESNLVESLFSQHDSYDSKKSTNVLSKLAKNVTIISKTSNDKDSTRISQSCNSIVDKRHVQRIDNVAIVKGTISNNFKTDCPVSFDNNKNAVQISSDVAHSSNSIVEQKTNNSKPNMKDSMLKIDKIESKPRRTSTRVVCNNNNMQQISATQLDFKKLSAKSDKKTVPSAKNARKQKETGLVKYAFKHKKLSNIKKSKSNRSLHNNVDIPCLSYTGPREGNIIHDIQFASVSYKKGSKYFDFIPWPTNKCNITHLIVSKLQTKPTLKILYALANKSYILTPNYVYYAIQNGNWPAEEDCEHPEWPKLKERNNVKLPFKGSKFYLVSNLKKISISDAATIIQKLGGKLVKTLEESTYILSESKTHYEEYVTPSRKVVYEHDFINTISLWNCMQFGKLMELKDSTSDDDNDVKLVDERFQKRDLNEFAISDKTAKDDESSNKLGGNEGKKFKRLKKVKLKKAGDNSVFSDSNRVFYDTPFYSDEELGYFGVDEVF